MKYNHAFSGGDFADYQRYLENIKDKIPEELFEFASNPERHGAEPNGLHDSWLLGINVNYLRDKENRSLEKRKDIAIELLGSYHDRKFCITFKDVDQYSLTSNGSLDCDLITWEIYLEDHDGEERLVFNSEFADGSEIKATCRQISIAESPLA